MSYPTIKKIALDIYNNNIVCFNAKQWDTGSRYVEITCTEYGKKIVLDSYSTKAYIVYLKADGTYGIDDVTVLSDGCLSVELTQNMLAASGRCKFDVILADAAGTIEINEENGKLVVTDAIIISPMCFYVNVLSSTVDHTLLESSNEFNAFTNAISKNIAIEKELRENEDTRIANENQRIDDEDTRIANENQRIDDEDTRKLNESKRISTFNTNEQNRQTTFEANEEDRQDSFESGETERQSSFNTNEGTRQTTFENTMNAWQKEVNDVIDNCEKVTGAAEQAENTRQTTFNDMMASWDEEIENKVEELTKNEYARIASENQRIISEEARVLAETQRQNTFNEQIAEMDEIVERINGSISGVINDTVIASDTTYSSEKINNLLQVINQLSNPNLLINGDFQVWQRGTSFEFDGGGITKYLADRWCTNTQEHRIVQKVDGGISVNKGWFRQILENNLEVGEEYTLSAEIDGKVEIIHIVGGTNYDSNNGHLFYEAVGNGGSVYNYDAVGFGSDTELTCKWIKLEKGSIATPFIPKSYGEELLLCQRYYQVRIVNPIIIYKYSDSKIMTCILLSVPMRKTPLVSSTYAEYYSGGLGKTDAYIETFGYCDNERITATIYCPSGLDSSAHSLVMSACFDAEIY